MPKQMKRDPLIPNLSISALFDISSLGHNKDIVIHQKELTITRQQLKKDRLILSKALLALGVKPGDIVTVATSRSTYENILLFLSINKIGAVASFFDEKTPLSTLTSYLEEFKSPVLVTYQKNPDYRKKIKQQITTLKHVVNLDGTPDLSGFTEGRTSLSKIAAKFKGRMPNMTFAGKREALISFTSGSTSGPKPMVFTNSNLIAAAMYPKSASGIKMWDKEIRSWLSFVKFDCPYGLWTSVMTPILGGSSVILTPDINEDNLDYYLGQKPNTISCVPLLLELMQKKIPEDFDLSFVKLVISGGERLEEESSRAALEFFKQHGSMARICNGYGVGEALGCISIAVGDTYRPGTVGKLVRGVKPLVLDSETGEELGRSKIGMLYVGGKHILNRYYNRPELDKDKIIIHNGERYVKTGDLVSIDTRDFITLIGRATFFINNLPAKVYYEVVRAAIARVNVVYQCYVVKKPDVKLGYATIAFVVLKEGTPRNNDTRRHIVTEAAKPFYIGRRRLQLKGYELPRKVVFLDELPLTNANKTNFRKLEQMAKELN